MLEPTASQRFYDRICKQPSVKNDRWVELWNGLHFNDGSCAHDKFLIGTEQQLHYLFGFVMSTVGRMDLEFHARERWKSLKSHLADVYLSFFWETSHRPAFVWLTTCQPTGIPPAVGRATVRVVEATDGRPVRCKAIHRPNVRLRRSLHLFDGGTVSVPLRLICPDADECVDLTTFRREREVLDLAGGRRSCLLQDELQFLPPGKTSAIQRGVFDVNFIDAYCPPVWLSGIMCWRSYTLRLGRTFPGRQLRWGKAVESWDNMNVEYLYMTIPPTACCPTRLGACISDLNSTVQRYPLLGKAITGST
jgi:hypothetical protein